MNVSSEKQTERSKKRLRQASILESFKFTKRVKNTERPQEKDQPVVDISMEASLEIPPSETSPSDSEPALNQDIVDLSLDEKQDSSGNLSEDLFPDVSSDSDTQPYPEASKRQETVIHSLDNLPFNRTPACNPILPPLWSNSNHKVLFNCHITPGRVPKPYPAAFRDSWDGDHVRMPCSSSSMYPVTDTVTGVETLQPRWEVIQRNLLRPMESSLDLREAILSYNSQYQNRWNFQELNRLFTETLEPAETQYFFNNLLPKMAELALQLPLCCTHPIPMLKRDRSMSLTISQHQISCLLANAFFCTFPRRNAQGKNSEYSWYPDINFNRMFAKGGRDCKGEKLKCIFNYFKRVVQDTPTGVVTFERRSRESFPNWAHSERKLSKLYISADGFIESDGTGLLQVDFANKRVGGGVLSSGCVQEEIRFITCPELIVSRLFTERLGESEVLVITGCEQYSSHSGYGDSFSWDGDYIDVTPRDAWERRCIQVVAMDALHFHNKELQYSVACIGRETNKAFCAFDEPDIDPAFLSAIATGNWGCGAFQGDPRLKALLQLIAASEANRDLVYFTFGDQQLRDDVEALYDCLIQKGVTVGKLWSVVRKFDGLKKANESLYSFIYNSLNGGRVNKLEEWLEKRKADNT